MSALRHTDQKARAGWALAGALAIALTAVGFSWFGSADRLCERGPSRVESVWNAQRRARFEATPALLQRIDAFGQRWAESYREACEATHVYGEQSPELLDRRVQCLDGKLRELDTLLVTASEGEKLELAATTDALLEVVRLDRCRDPRYLAAVSAYTRSLPPEVNASSTALREQLMRARHQLYLGPFDGGLAEAEKVQAAADQSGDEWLEAEALLLGAEFQGKLRTRTGEASKVPHARLEEASLLGIQTGNMPLVAEAWIAKTQLYILEGEFAEARRTARHADAYLKAAGHVPLLELRLLSVRATLAMRENKLAEAAHLLDEAAVLRAQVPAAELGKLAVELSSTRFLVDHMAGQVDRSIEHLEVAIREAEALYGPVHDTLGTMHHNAAEAELTRNRLDAAGQHYERSGEIWLTLYGPRHAIRGVHLGSMTHWHLARGEPQVAAKLVEETLGLYRELGLDRSFLAVRALCSKGQVQRALEQRAEGRRTFQQAMALIPNAKGLYPLDELDCRVAFGELLVEDGRIEEARTELKRAVELGGPEGKENWRRARPEMWLAVAESNPDRLQQAVALLERYGVHAQERARAVALAKRRTAAAQVR
jgi:tetratricopeptide (TPR) repeat protein